MSQYQNQKKPLLYSKKEIERAGKSIRSGVSGSDYDDAILKIRNYREWHLYPLMLIKNHVSQTVVKVDKNGYVVRRLKMLSTILDKLTRPTLDGVTANNIEIVRMQDIGGCRVVVSNANNLKDLYERLKKSRSQHVIFKENDYREPKDSGYGGIHLIYSCFENSSVSSDWKKTKIEVQLRTELQHAWATSLEIIDTIENMNIKTSLVGHDDWRRFFSIAGAFVAQKEGFISLSLDEISNLKSEFSILERKLDVLNKLMSFRISLDATNKAKIIKVPARNLKENGYFVVALERGKKPGSLMARVKLFEPNKINDAIDMLSRLESDGAYLSAVMISAKDAKNLERAYPNFFGSTNTFGKFVRSCL